MQKTQVSSSARQCLTWKGKGKKGRWAYKLAWQSEAQAKSYIKRNSEQFPTLLEQKPYKCVYHGWHIGHPVAVPPQQWTGTNKKSKKIAEVIAPVIETPVEQIVESVVVEQTPNNVQVKPKTTSIADIFARMKRAAIKLIRFL